MESYSENPVRDFGKRVEVELDNGPAGTNKITCEIDDVATAEREDGYIIVTRDDAGGKVIVVPNRDKITELD